MNELTMTLGLAGLLFMVGLGCVLTRRHAIGVLIGVELMLNAANINLIAFWRFGEATDLHSGVLFVMFAIGVAAAEAAVGLALVLAVYRHYKTVSLDKVEALKG